MQSWIDVDDYVASKLLPADPALVKALAANAAAGLPAIDVSPAQGRMLELIVRLCKARRVLEIGTLGGYSTIWLARSLTADGEVVTLELDAKHAAVARSNIAGAGLRAAVEVREGPALASLDALQAEGGAPFDLVFIDADKPSNPAYLAAAIALGRPGTVIILDNVVRRGDVVDAESRDASVLGTRSAFDLLASHPRIDATAIQTVGAKGWDGFILAVMT